MLNYMLLAISHLRHFLALAGGKQNLVIRLVNFGTPQYHAPLLRVSLLKTKLQRFCDRVAAVKLADVAVLLSHEGFYRVDGV
jgi:hypothetical protein